MIKGCSGPEVPVNPFCPCGAASSERHHIVRRSKLAGAYNWVYDSAEDQVAVNVIDLCSDCHRKATLEGEEWKVSSFEPEARYPPFPGEDCYTCGRKIPYPKTKKSPETKVFSYRVPQGSVEDHAEILKQAAEKLKIYKKPHWKWGVVTTCCAWYCQFGEEDPFR